MKIEELYRAIYNDNLEQGLSDVRRLILDPEFKTVYEAKDSFESTRMVIGTPAECAAGLGRLDILKALGETGVSMEGVLSRVSHKDGLPILKYVYETYKMDLNEKDNMGHTLLHQAARDGLLEMVQYLMAQPSVSHNPHNKWKETPILLAAKHDQKAVVGVLLSIGIRIPIEKTIQTQNSQRMSIQLIDNDPAVQAGTGSSQPIVIFTTDPVGTDGAMQTTPERIIIGEDNGAGSRTSNVAFFGGGGGGSLLGSRLNPDTTKACEYYYKLFADARLLINVASGRVIGFEGFYTLLLDERFKNIQLRNEHGRTLLHLTTVNGNASAVEFLLDHGYRANDIDHRGRSVLESALELPDNPHQQRSTETILYLLVLDAIKNTKVNSVSRTLFNDAVLKGRKGAETFSSSSSSSSSVMSPAVDINDVLKLEVDIVDALRKSVERVAKDMKNENFKGEIYYQLGLKIKEFQIQYGSRIYFIPFMETAFKCVPKDSSASCNAHYQLARMRVENAPDAEKGTAAYMRNLATALELLWEAGTSESACELRTNLTTEFSNGKLINTDLLDFSRLNFNGFHPGFDANLQTLTQAKQSGVAVSHSLQQQRKEEQNQRKQEQKLGGSGLRPRARSASE